MYFGPYGGRFVPETLIAALDELARRQRQALAIDVHPLLALLDQAQRMIERQEVDEGAEAQCLGGLRHGREEQSGRSGAAERRRMMFGEVIAVDAAAVIGFDQLEPIGVELPKWPARIVHVVEHAEFHASVPRKPLPPPGPAVRPGCSLHDFERPLD